MVGSTYFLRLKGSFRAKVFSLFILFISVVSLSFIIFYIRHESRSYLEQLVNEGKLISSLLAFNARHDVFADNRKMLHASAEVIMGYEHVKSVAIFASDGGLLAAVRKSGAESDGVLKNSAEQHQLAALLDKLKSPSFFENSDDILFYAPIMTEAVSSTSDESVHFTSGSRPAENRTIGLVRIALEKKDLNRRVENLLLVGILFLTVFLIAGIASAYLVLRGITKPLNSLMTGVRALGKGDFTRRIPVETEDEVGKVALAFNTMVETLGCREAEKMQLQAQLRHAQQMEAKAEWERTFDTIPDLIAILDLEHGIVRLNSTMADRLGITKEEAVGKKCFEIFHASKAPNAECLCMRLLRAGQELETEIYEPKLDSHFWITMTPLRKADGDLIGCVHVARDITERKRAEEEKKTIQAKLVQTNKMTSLGLLVSGMAHEVNNPNNSIKLTAHVLGKTWNDVIPILDKYYREEGDFVIGGHRYSQIGDALPQLITGITESSRRIEGIIKNLRDFVRKGKADLSMRADLNRIVSVSASILNNQIKTHTRYFTLDLAGGMPEVRGNSQQLEQVVINLIMNAVQSLPDEERTVCVSTSFDVQTGFASIKVRDDGCGMPQEVKNRLFEPFFSTKLESGGTGLGLAISNVIVKDHRGFMEFYSEPGKGTTAIVKLPTI